MLNSKTFYVCSYLSEIGNTFSRLVAAINPAYKVIKDFNFSGVRFFVKLMDKNTVNIRHTIMLADLRLGLTQKVIQEDFLTFLL